MPARQRLLDEGLEFRRYYTHTSPCSPSRATLFTGQYVSRHGVNENIIHPVHRELDPAIPTIGHEVRDLGYKTSYLGKWHLSHSATPDMESYGFSDWTGNDRAYMGWAGTGVEFDPMITDQAVDWLGTNGAQRRAVVPHGGAGQPPRRDVVPARPARLPRGPPRPGAAPPARCSRP